MLHLKAEDPEVDMMPEEADGAGSINTVNLTREGAVLFAEIAAPPMNLLGPELVRDLVSLIQRAEADDSLQGRGLHERRP